MGSVHGEESAEHKEDAENQREKKEEKPEHCDMAVVKSIKLEGGTVLTVDTLRPARFSTIWTSLQVHHSGQITMPHVPSEYGAFLLLVQ